MVSTMENGRKTRRVSYPRAILLWYSCTLVLHGCVLKLTCNLKNKYCAFYELEDELNSAVAIHPPININTPKRRINICGSTLTKSLHKNEKTDEELICVKEGYRFL